MLEPSLSPFPFLLLHENVLSDVNKINYGIKLPVSKASLCAISRQKELGYGVNNDQKKKINYWIRAQFFLWCRPDCTSFESLCTTHRLRSKKLRFCNDVMLSGIHCVGSMKHGTKPSRKAMRKDSLTPEQVQALRRGALNAGTRELMLLILG